MKLKGMIELLKSPRRPIKDFTPPEGDNTEYLLALKITEIDGKSIKSLADTRNAIQIPEIKLKGQAIDNTSFVDYTVLPGMAPVSHLSLAYSVYFREGTKPTGAIMQARVNAAQAWVGKEIELTSDNLEVVFTGVGATNVNDLTISAGKLSTAPTLGVGRDTGINIVPNEEGQLILSKITESVCGMKNLTTSTGAPIHYHLTAAQANLASTFNNILGVAPAGHVSAGGYNATTTVVNNNNTADADSLKRQANAI